MALLHVKQLFLGDITTTSSPGSTCYTVPAGYRVKVQNLQFRNISSSLSYSLLISINSILVYSYSLAVSETHQTDVAWVLEPGDKINARAGNVAGVHLLISGSIYYL